MKGVQGQSDEPFLFAGKLVPIIRFYQFYDLEPERADPAKAFIVIIQDQNKKYSLMVDELLQRQQVVIKNLSGRFNHLPGITGGTILGDGSVGLILEPEE